MPDFMLNYNFPSGLITWVLLYYKILTLLGWMRGRGSKDIGIMSTIISFLAAHSFLTWSIFAVSSLICESLSCVSRRLVFSLNEKVLLSWLDNGLCMQIPWDFSHCDANSYSKISNILTTYGTHGLIPQYVDNLVFFKYIT